MLRTLLGPQRECDVERRVFGAFECDMSRLADVEPEDEAVLRRSRIERELREDTAKAIAAAGPVPTRIDHDDRRPKPLAIGPARAHLSSAARALEMDRFGRAARHPKRFGAAHLAEGAYELAREPRPRRYWKRSHVPFARHPC